MRPPSLAPVDCNAEVADTRNGVTSYGKVSREVGRGPGYGDERCEREFPVLGIFLPSP